MRHYSKRITNQHVERFLPRSISNDFANACYRKKPSDYFQRAIKHSSRLIIISPWAARHTIYRAHVKNNVGYLLFKLSRFRKAHEYLDHARRLLISVRDKVRVAQVDDTRAQVFIAQHKYAEAEVTARNAVSSLGGGRTQDVS